MAIESKKSEEIPVDGVTQDEFQNYLDRFGGLYVGTTVFSEKEREVINEHAVPDSNDITNIQSTVSGTISSSTTTTTGTSDTTSATSTTSSAGGIYITDFEETKKISFVDVLISGDLVTISVKEGKAQGEKEEKHTTAHEEHE